MNIKLNIEEINYAKERGPVTTGLACKTMVYLDSEGENVCLSQ